MSASRPVFGVGLNKTGTVSLHRALEILGYRSLHWGGPPARALVRRAMSRGEPLLSYLEPRPEAISDLEEITNSFELLDRQYPGSRFILTVRDLDAWLDSRRRHVEHNRRAREAGMYAGGFLEVEGKRWAADYRRHERRVREYFAGRPSDLLVLDVAGGNGWAPLCGFLGRAQPDEPFPSENRYRPWEGEARPRGWRQSSEASPPDEPARSAQRTE
jgi:hypothetical protein